MQGLFGSVVFRSALGLGTIFLSNRSIDKKVFRVNWYVVRVTINDSAQRGCVPHPHWASGPTSTATRDHQTAGPQQGLS